MALTITEQLTLMDGGNTPPETDLLTLVHQTAFEFVKTFYDNYKEFDSNTYPLANTYLSKMFSIINLNSNNDVKTLERLSRMIVVLIGQSTVTLVQLQAADQTSWEVFISNNIDEAIEYIAGVRRNEKTEYINIV